MGIGILKEVVKAGWHRQLTLKSKIDLLRELTCLKGNRYMKLKELGILVSTYYSWQRRYQAERNLADTFI